MFRNRLEEVRKRVSIQTEVTFVKDYDFPFQVNVTLAFHDEEFVQYVFHCLNGPIIPVFESGYCGESDFREMFGRKLGLINLLVEKKSEMYKFKNLKKAQKFALKFKKSFALCLARNFIKPYLTYKALEQHYTENKSAI